jgi:hypothetical protein
MRATRIISVGIAVILVALPCWAGNHGEDDWIDPNKLLDNPQDQNQNQTYSLNHPYQPNSSNYDPTKIFSPKELAMLKAGDPGQAVDKSGNAGAAAMATVALAGAPSLIATLGGGGATVIGTPPAFIASALQFFNTTAGAANYTFDFSEGATLAQQTASAGIILQGALNAINQAIVSGVIPWVDQNGVPLSLGSLQTLYTIFSNFLRSGPTPGVGQSPTDPQNTTVATTDSLTDLADASIGAGGSADAGAGDPGS